MRRYTIPELRVRVIAAAVLPAEVIPMTPVRLAEVIRTIPAITTGCLADQVAITIIITAVPTIALPESACARVTVIKPAPRAATVVTTGAV